MFLAGIQVPKRSFVDIKLVLNDAGRNETRRMREYGWYAYMVKLRQSITTMFQLKSDWMECQEYFLQYIDSDGDLIDFSSEKELMVGLNNIRESCPKEGPKEFRIYITKKGTGVRSHRSPTARAGGDGSGLFHPNYDCFIPVNYIDVPKKKSIRSRKKHDS